MEEKRREYTIQLSFKDKERGTETYLIETSEDFVLGAALVAIHSFGGDVKEYFQVEPMIDIFNPNLEGYDQTNGYNTTVCEKYFLQDKIHLKHTNEETHRGASWACRKMDVQD